MGAEAEAVEEFVSGHYDAVRRALGIALGDWSRAEEVTQEAFAQLWRHWPRVSLMERPVAWVYVVAMNRAKRELRRTMPVDLVETTRPGSVDESAAVATAVSVRTALECLAPRQRAAVVLRYLADLSIAEVADAMGCAEGTVKSTLHSALARMRVELDDQEDR